MVWADDDDDFGPIMEVGNRYDDGLRRERRRLLPETGGSSSGNVREVKIKITKKELEDLLARVDMQGVTLEHVLAQLMNINATVDSDRPADMQRQSSWRPALQSIPEVN